MKRRTMVFAICAISAMIFMAAAWDYRAYAQRTNASAIWGWAVTRMFELANPSTDVVHSAGLVQRLKARNARAYLARGLPLRTGPRPTMVRGIPHRQLEQHPPASERQELLSGIAAFAKQQSPRMIRLNTSLWELTGAQAMILGDCDTAPCSAPLRKAKGEFFHLHSFDGSAHMLLSPADLAEVVEKGWGELFPISNADGGYIPLIGLVYAPRTPEERDIFLLIAAAAFKFSISEEH